MSLEQKQVETWRPADIDRVTQVFPASVSHLMPKYESIPEEYRNLNSTKWNRLVSAWFYFGLNDLEVSPKPGIDKDKALIHIRTILGSYEPKHEHKEAACAYLCSLWFDDAKYTVAARKE